MAVLTSDVALTGIPRGGTTLACRLLGNASDAVALFEPMQVERLSRDPDTACAEVLAYFRQVRERIASERHAPSKLHDGSVPSNPFADRAPDGTRASRTTLGDLAVDKPLTDHFHLMIKHNAAFLALLPVLVGKMPVLGVLRHPLAVLCSWNSVDLPVTRGRLPAGEQLAPELARCLAAEPDVLARQLRILDWSFERLLRWLPSGQLLTYEDIVASGGKCLYAAAGVDGPWVELRNRNARPQCDRDRIPVLAEALKAHGGPGVETYGVASIDALAASMLKAWPNAMQ